MAEYTLSSGETFQTVILPKGTILFGGFDLNTDKPRSENVFMDLFGYQDKDGYYCVDPHDNKFFYPAPFVSDTVGRFSIHTVYHTNYDLEIILLVKPAKDARSNLGSNKDAFLRCSYITTPDHCGRVRKAYDPCLSPLLITEYPHIQGYIAIAEKDADIFKRGQIPAFMRNTPEAIEFIRPFIVSNSRDIQGVPEIVLFPFHARPESVLDELVIHPRAVEPNLISYAIANRAKLNYFPLVYVTENGYSSFKELVEPARLEELAKTERDNWDFDSPLTLNMIRFMNAALDSKGFFIGHIPYKFTVDLRTGFYLLDTPDVRKLNTSIRKINVISSDYSGEPLVVPFHYPANVKKKIHTSLSRTVTEESLEGTLNKLYGSYSKHYMFDKGKPVLVQPKYTMELALPRPELDAPRKKYTLKSKKRQ